MDKSKLVQLFGFPATLIHGDTGVLDRWRWLKQRLPRTNNNELLIDIGCGTGAFSIGASLRGYRALGLSWDTRNQLTAQERAALSGAKTATFEIQDVRLLDQRRDLFERFDIAICTENIEHILDDRKLMKDIARCLKPGGVLLLTAPYYLYRAITPADNGPFERTETGWHVRRGYTRSMLSELCEQADLKVEDYSYCTGFVSQKCTYAWRVATRYNWALGWAATLPLRVLPFLLDRPISALLRWPYLSICLEAYKPRFPKHKRSEIDRPRVSAS